MMCVHLIVAVPARAADVRMVETLS